MEKHVLVLASSSPSRKKLLQRLKIPFACMSPHVDESPLENEVPEDMVQRLAVMKAQAVAKHFPSTQIIGCDQVAVLNGKVFGKPLNHETAVAQLKICSGKTVTFINGLCLLDSNTGEHQIGLERILVTYRQLSPRDIEHYLHRERPYQCAGSTKVESSGIVLIERIESHDPNALEGLPLIHLVSMLKKANVDLFVEE